MTIHWGRLSYFKKFLCFGFYRYPKCHFLQMSVYCEEEEKKILVLMAQTHFKKHVDNVGLFPYSSTPFSLLSLVTSRKKDIGIGSTNKTGELVLHCCKNLLRKEKGFAAWRESARAFSIKSTPIKHAYIRWKRTNLSALPQVIVLNSLVFVYFYTLMLETSYWVLILLYGLFRYVFVEYGYLATLHETARTEWYRCLSCALCLLIFRVDIVLDKRDYLLFPRYRSMATH